MTVSGIFIRVISTALLSTEFDTNRSTWWTRTGTGGDVATDNFCNNAQHSYEFNLPLDTKLREFVPAHIFILFTWEPSEYFPSACLLSPTWHLSPPQLSAVVGYVVELVEFYLIWLSWRRKESSIVRSTPPHWLMLYEPWLYVFLYTSTEPARGFVTCLFYFYETLCHSCHPSIMYILTEIFKLKTCILLVKLFVTTNTVSFPPPSAIPHHTVCYLASFIAGFIFCVCTFILHIYCVE